MQNVNEIMEVQETKKKNKGFSLVELIIVIAIMAILVGVVGTQVLPYMEKSREAKDLQLVSALCTASTTAFAENADKLSGDATLIFGSTETGNADVLSAVRTYMGVTGTTNLFTSYFKGSVASKVAKTANSAVVTYSYTTGNISVQLHTAADGTGTAVLSAVESK